MTMADNYKEFDTSSIISRDTVSIGKFTLRKRDMLFAGITLLAIAMVIILAIFLAVEAGKCQPSLSSINGHSGQTGNLDESYCTTPACLKTAYYEKSIMNESVNPCINFYQFACGGYDDEYTPNQLIPDQNPYNQIYMENTQKLLHRLYFEPERQEEHSYERKLRHFLYSCNNHFDKMELRGQPFLDQIIKPFGGWYVLGQWNPSSFDLHTQLKKVHIDFWAPAFFTLTISTDTTDWNMKIIEVDIGGIGLVNALYHPVFMDLYKNEYTGYMKHLAQFFVRDAGVPTDMNKITEFAVDAFEVERELAEIIMDSYPLYDPHAAANRYTLGELNNLIEHTFDFVDYFKSTFPSVSSLFVESYAIAVLRDRFFHKLGPMLKNYTSTDDGKRKLHNYLVWQMISKYAPHLSWDYVHAKRQINHYFSDITDDTSGASACLEQAQRSMKEAIGAIFIKSFVNMKDKQEATDILSLIRDEMLKELTNLNWMTNSNREEAIKKIKDSLYKIGYPDYMVDDEYMDSLYKVLNISDVDYFGNVLRMNNLHRTRIENALAKPDSKTAWAYRVFDAVVEYYNPWFELIVTAGMLQNPLFAHNGPSYYNYGGIGTILATHLIHAFDEYGSMYKHDKSNFGDWWTNATNERYLVIKECAINAQKEATLGPFQMSNAKSFSPDKTEVSLYHAPELLATAGGLRLSFKAYKAKNSKPGPEKIPPGFFKYSQEQMFFVAFAQANCQNTPDYIKADYIMRFYTPPGDYSVNLAVSQVQEFRDAFKCSKGDPMAPEHMCTLF